MYITILVLVSLSLYKWACHAVWSTALELVNLITVTQVHYLKSKDSTDRAKNLKAQSGERVHTPTIGTKLVVVVTRRPLPFY
jgi:hypothetical protein